MYLLIRLVRKKSNVEKSEKAKICQSQKKKCLRQKKIQSLHNRRRHTKRKFVSH